VDRLRGTHRRHTSACGERDSSARSKDRRRAVTDPRDYYETLGVTRDADEKAIKEAFRQLALKYHPDRNKAPDATERFKEIAEAHAILSDPEKRAEYDAGGRAGVAGFSAEDLFGGIDFGDIFGGFGSLFWGGGAG